MWRPRRCNGAGGVCRPGSNGERRKVSRREGLARANYACGVASAARAESNPQGSGKPLADTPGAVEIRGGKPFALTKLGEAQMVRNAGGAVWVISPPVDAVPFYQAALGEKALAADLLLGLGEVVGCGERCVSASDLRASLKRANLDIADYGDYILLKERWPLRTSGFGIGLERLIAFMLGHDASETYRCFPFSKVLPVHAEDVEGLLYSDLVGLVGETNRPSGGIVTIQELVMAAMLRSSSLVLEIGCTTGFSSIAIAEITGAKVIGIDVHALALERARSVSADRGVCGIEFIVADASNLPFEHDQFDLVWASNVPSFVANRRADVLAECIKVLRRRGSLALTPIFYRSPPSPEVRRSVERLLGVPVLDWTPRIGSTMCRTQLKTWAR